MLTWQKACQRLFPGSDDSKMTILFAVCLHTTTEMWFTFGTFELLFLGLCCLFAHSTQQEGRNILCYYALANPGSVTELQPESIDPNVCTHIILGFASISKNNSLVPENPYDTETYEKIMKLKQKQPTLKVILAAGGGKSAAHFSTMVHTAESRSSFINQSLPFLHQYGFDGFDLDWEFPVFDTDHPEDRDLFVTFLKEFRLAADKFWASRENSFLLTVDVAAIPIMADISYNIPEMAKYVDYVNIMCYDYNFYTWYNPFTGHNSPLFKRSYQFGYLAKLNVAGSATFWVSRGMPKSKINVGIPTYGHTYNLLFQSWHGFNAPTRGEGMFGGTITYPLVCKFLKNGAVEVFDEESQVPYAYQGYDWAAFDNIASITAKTQWVRANDFAGLMTFDLNCDDWAGTCDGTTTFPLHKAIQNALKSPSQRKEVHS